MPRVLAARCAELAADELDDLVDDLVGFGVRQYERREEANHLSLGDVQKEPGLQGALHEALRRLGEFDAQHQAVAPHFADPVVSREGLLEAALHAVAEGGHPGQGVAVGQHGEGGEGGGAGQGVARPAMLNASAFNVATPVDCSIVNKSPTLKLPSWSVAV